MRLIHLLAILPLSFSVLAPAWAKPDRSDTQLISQQQACSLTGDWSVDYHDGDPYVTQMVQTGDRLELIQPFDGSFYTVEGTVSGNSVYMKFAGRYQNFYGTLNATCDRIEGQFIEGDAGQYTLPLTLSRQGDRPTSIPPHPDVVPPNPNPTPNGQENWIW